MSEEEKTPASVVLVSVLTGVLVGMMLAVIGLSLLVAIKFLVGLL